jgi:hypothetical protein
LCGRLGDNVTAGEWALEGLPVDDLSLENGIITTKATRYPLMIDPQGQGNNWIKNRQGENGLIVTTLDHKYFRMHLENALGNGKPILIEDVGEVLDPCLDNILAKNFIKQGSSLKVKIGDAEADVMDGFTMYITTKLANPSYTPEVFAVRRTNCPSPFRPILPLHWRSPEVVGSGRRRCRLAPPPPRHHFVLPRRWNRDWLVLSRVARPFQTLAPRASERVARHGNAARHSDIHRSHIHRSHTRSDIHRSHHTPVARTSVSDPTSRPPRSSTLR